MALRTPFANDAKTYGFEWLRGLLEASLQEGVLNMGGVGTDFKATVQAGTMRIDVAAGAAMVKGDSGTQALGITQGLFMVVNDAAVVTAVTLDAADATLPRIDQICLKVEDSSDLGSSADQATIVVVKGTATAGATLDNRNGAAALPSNHLRLRDQLVPAAAASLLEANGRDRRPWARGALFRFYDASTRSIAVGGVVPLTVPSARIELAGGPVSLEAEIQMDASVAGARIDFGPRVGGTAMPLAVRYSQDVAGRPVDRGHHFDLPNPVAGSNLIDWQGGNQDSGTASINRVFYVFREELRPSALNA